MNEPLASRLVGTWRLVLYETVDEGGRRSRPYDDAVGRLTYDRDGNMTGQVMRPNRAPVSLGEGYAQQVRAAYIGYIAYFGTYEVAGDGRSVVHRVEASLNPGWVGGNQVRTMRFEGGRLILEANVEKAGGIVRHELTWERC
jgi:lipocalin-like protein